MKLYRYIKSTKYSYTIQPNSSDYQTSGESDIKHTIEVNLDGQRIEVEKGGSWTYLSDSFDWILSDSKSATYKDSSVEIEVDDVEGILQHIDDIMLPQVPVRGGQYELSGTAVLVYNIDTVKHTSTFSFIESYLDDFSIEPV